MKKIYFYLMITIGLVFLNGCKEEDDAMMPNTEVTLPAEAYRLQIVEAKFSKPLSQETYDGTLGGAPITLARADENTLFFYVPGNVALGQALLVVPDLSISNSFEVKNPELKGSVETIMKPVFEKITPENQNISNAEYADYLTTVNTAFKDYYQTLSQEEKNNMALFYQVNESFFAEILNPELQQGKSVEENYITTVKFSVATYVFVTTAPLLALPGTPGEKALIAVVSIAGAVKSWDYGNELIEEIIIVFKIFTESFKSETVNQTFGADKLTFVNDISKSVNFYTEQREMNPTDSSGTTRGLSTFFGAYQSLTDATKKVNDIILFINDHVFFANIPQIPISAIPASSTSENSAMTNDFYKYLKFTVADANVKITETSFENGAIRMKMKITNPNAVTGKTINTQLNYTYQEDFNNISGSIPIEINLEEEFKLTGLWHFEHYGSDNNGGFILAQIFEIDFNDGSNNIGHTLRIYFDSRWDFSGFPSFPGYGWHDFKDLNGFPYIWNQGFNSSTLQLHLSVDGGVFVFNYNPQNPNLLLDAQQGTGRYQLVKK
ncbi:MAG TPA: hypothetical protein VLY87_08130 [Flavobacterium sp.]|nr:hypothetical protein [Flavobacterium sp.]